MHWKNILQLLSKALQGFQDPAAWRVSRNGQNLSGALQRVRLATNGLEFKLESLQLRATWDGDRLFAHVNEELQPQARVTLSLRHQVLRPMILVVQFSNLKIDGGIQRFRFDVP
jgi:hypothetical protein